MDAAEDVLKKTCFHFGVSGMSDLCGPCLCSCFGKMVHTGTPSPNGTALQNG